MRWINLEPVTQSEVSQKEKDKYCILTHIYGIWKKGPEEFTAGQPWRSRHREQTCGHGERGERVRYMERVTWKLTLSCVKSMADGNLLYGSGNSKRGSVSI